MKKLFCLIAALVFSLTCFAFPVHAEEKIKVACVGDSITEGWASTNTETQSYPVQLQKLLGDEYEVKNFSKGGRTAMKVAGGYWPIWNEGFFTQSKTYNPDVVILMLGTNDVMTDNWNDGETYYPDLKALVETYQGLSSQPTVYLATPSTAFDSEHPDKLQNKAVPIVKQVAEETGAVLVDINALTANNGQYYPDGIHPNDEGYARLALMFYEHVFNKEVFDLTVKTEAGNTVRIGEISAVAGADGKAVIPAVKGDVSFTVGKLGNGFVKKSVTVNGDTEVDCTDATFPENLAASGTLTDSAGNVTAVTDANASTGWQSGNGDYSDVFISCDFGAAKDFNAIDLMWEETTRAKKDAYTVEYSADGTTWTAVSNAKFVFSGSYDYATFDSVNAQYVRVKISDGVSGKARPKLFEMGVYTVGDETPATVTTPADVSSDTASEPAGNAKADNGAWIYIVIAVAAVVVIVLALILAKKKK